MKRTVLLSCAFLAGVFLMPEAIGQPAPVEEVPGISITEGPTGGKGKITAKGKFTPKQGNWKIEVINLVYTDSNNQQHRKAATYDEATKTWSAEATGVPAGTYNVHAEIIFIEVRTVSDPGDPPLMRETYTTPPAGSTVTVT